MLATAATESASDWDFTQALDLLRSPTYGVGSNLTHNADPHVASSSEERLGQRVSRGASSCSDQAKPQESHSKLGDFRLIWDHLNKDSSSPRNESFVKDSQHLLLEQLPALTILPRPLPDERSKETISTPHKSIPALNPSKSQATKAAGFHQFRRTPPSPAQQPVTILKRAADNYTIKSNVTAALPPRTQPEVTASITKPTNIPNPRNRAKPAGKVAKSEPGIIPPESSIGSDSGTVVFDQPISKKPGGLALVQSHVGGLDKRGDHDDTPPSSYDEAEWTLNSDAIQNIITASTGIKVLPTAYKNQTERRIGLMTKLLRDFPEYAQLVSQVGRCPTSKKSVDPRPIHVFVDMSNVCLHTYSSLYRSP